MDKDFSLLIICNNVLSTTFNNGKTVLSCIDGIPEERIAQLYIDERTPEIKGYRYFKLSDKDIIKGLLNPSRRGCEIQDHDMVVKGRERVKKDEKWKPLSYVIPKNTLTKCLRETIWKNNWKSAVLDKWLDRIKPTCVFFVGGDTLFTYDICNYIVQRYDCRLALYITDDYLGYQKYDLFKAMETRRLKKKLSMMVNNSDVLFTISEQMRAEYRLVFKKDSKVLHNIPSSLRDNTLIDKTEDTNIIRCVYAGSHYYGRLELLLKLGKVIEEYNTTHDHCALLDIYFNLPIKKREKDCFLALRSVMIHDRVDEVELIRIYNTANVLVYVESFSPAQIRKVRLSFSTKIPEYLSVGKAILAIGPEEVASMQYLRGVACCVNKTTELNSKVSRLLSSKELRTTYSKKAIKKYTDIEDYSLMRKMFRKSVGFYD